MQGIEPKIHNSLTERMDSYRYLIKKMEEYDAESFEIISRASELQALYEDYLSNKKKLEKSIKDYKQFHDDLRKLITVKLRELKRKSKK
ncbi:MULTISPECIES: hypothetical protein [Chryseobacterium]|uniref:Prephenate dehydrogenase n=1 Tax=Chryseobacterium geocarposphaerae TaxID=1416776 RepID=A0ABU1LAF2_9FLAO|nr:MULTISPECIES: hypothetical protein [Chryseobacterium]ALR29559.1 hypothetical protein ATE47_03030 [Chryseobacterium sp. IHB B 17019]MDR6403688.1 prephenate dehydrogenase [Chryseobacterium geocarposphaerae]MDR6697242.1 prephenate dehydrogenase [Chryseobacterium ginsenosidimutans]